MLHLKGAASRGAAAARRRCGSTAALRQLCDAHFAQAQNSNKKRPKKRSQKFKLFRGTDARRPDARTTTLPYKMTGRDTYGISASFWSQATKSLTCPASTKSPKSEKKVQSWPHVKSVLGSRGFGCARARPARCRRPANRRQAADCNNFWMKTSP